MTRAIYPRDPGALPAYGILFSDITHDVARSRLIDATPESLPELGRSTDALMAEGKAMASSAATSTRQRRTITGSVAAQRIKWLPP